MTMLPPVDPTAKKLGIVTDLDNCVGCNACAVSCKEWNSGGHSAPLPDRDPFGSDPHGVWLNRVHGFEFGGGADGRTVYFPRACLHCENAACVEACPTGAAYKRAVDGIVLVNEDICIGCKLCSWACPYGAPEYDDDAGVMKKCTLCIDRIYNENLDEADRLPACVTACPTSARHFGDLNDRTSDVSRLVADRGAIAPMPELGYEPTNKYLPPRPRGAPKGGPSALAPAAVGKAADGPTDGAAEKLFRWIDTMLSR